MAREKRLLVPLEELPPPAVLARQIIRDLAAAQREFAKVARDLEGPQPTAADDEQLSLDL